MAQQKFSICLAGVGNYVLLLSALERALKKTFSPSLFEIVLLQYDSISATKVALQLSELRKGQYYPLDTGEFADLEARALLGFYRHPYCHCSIAIESNYFPSASKGKGIQSHYGLRTLMLENLACPDFSIHGPFNLAPYLSRVEMPYFGEGGSTDEQVELAMKSALKFLVEGWSRAGKRRQESILHRIAS